MQIKRGMGSVIEHGVCLLLIFAAAAVILHPCLTSDKLPIATDHVLFLAPWEDARPEGLSTPTSSLAQEQALRFYPWYTFIADASARGDSVVWNPLEDGGFPFLAAWRTRALSPFTVPFYFLVTHTALKLSVFLKFLMAGLCAFYAARRLGYLPPFALGVALSFQACGHMMLWWGWPLSDVMPWLPLIILFAEHLALRRERYWPFGAAVLALMLLGGDPETVVGCMIFAMLYLLSRYIMERSGARAATMGFFALGATAAIALTLAAVQILPYAEFLSLSLQQARAVPESGLRLGHLVLAFLPHFLGKPPAVTLNAGVLQDFRVANLLHVGIVQLLLLPLWFSLRRYVDPLQRQRVESLLIAASTCFLLAVFAAPSLARVPYLALFGPEHLLVANAFALALLAFSAAEEWLELDPDQCHATLKRLVYLMPPLLVLGLLLLLIQAHSERPYAPTAGRQILQAGIVAALALGALAFTLFRPWRWFLGLSLGLVAFAELYLAFHTGMVFTPIDRVFPETPFIQALKAGGGRVGGSAELGQWPLAGNLIPQAYGSSGIALKRHSQFVQQISDKPLLVRRTGSPILLLTKQDIQGPFAAVRSLLRVKRVFPSGAVLFEDMGARPQSWMAYNGRAVDRFDPAQLSAVEPPLIELSAAPQSGPGPEAQVQIDPSSTNMRVVARVTDTRAGILVLADTWYPGWQVTVDGVKTAALPVDGAFRGVSLEKGTHEVVFTYIPQVLRLGKQISAAACLLVLLGMLHFSILDMRDRRLSSKQGAA